MTNVEREQKLKKVEKHKNWKFKEQDLIWFVFFSRATSFVLVAMSWVAQAHWSIL